MPLNYATPFYAPRTDLREIAMRQKGVMICILGYVAAFIMRIAMPMELRIVPALVGVAAVVTGAVFVFMLALAVYNTGTGIVLGLLTLIPLIGLIVLLIVNGKATTILKSYGIAVGLMGAKMNQIPRGPMG